MKNSKNKFVWFLQQIAYYYVNKLYSFRLLDMARDLVLEWPNSVGMFMLKTIV